LVATTVVLGGIAGYFVSFYADNAIKYLLPFAAGGFIYIASSDLIPELRKESNLKKSVMMFATFLGGIFIMYIAKLIGE
jgi:zinc and cadmium transporter